MASTAPAPIASQPLGAPLLEVSSLRTVIETRHGSLAAVDDVSLSVRHGEVLGIVGESGSGKSLTLLSILGLLSYPVVCEAGTIDFDGRDLTRLSASEWRQVRGREISMIFQEPLTSLDPAFTIGRQLIETIRAHAPMSRREARAAAIEILEHVRISSAARRLTAYPHEFSGGMRQRVMIAMALVLRPRLLLADEPVTALDVTTQAQILDLIASLQQEFQMAVIIVSHDLGVVLDVADRVAVMYAGHIVESAGARTIYDKPRHPYSHGLLVSKLSLANKHAPVAVMPGRVPSLGERPAHCRFAMRCTQRIERCTAEMPLLQTVAAGHELRCFNPRTEKRFDA